MYFEPEVYENATLYVPQYTAKACHTADVLKEFKNIVEVEDMGINSQAKIAIDGLMYKTPNYRVNYFSLIDSFNDLVPEKVALPETITVAGKTYGVRYINLNKSTFPALKKINATNSQAFKDCGFEVLNVPQLDSIVGKAFY